MGSSDSRLVNSAHKHTGPVHLDETCDIAAELALTRYWCHSGSAMTGYPFGMRQPTVDHVLFIC
jgi:hypothetical protein